MIFEMNRAFIVSDHHLRENEWQNHAQKEIHREGRKIQILSPWYVETDFHPASEPFILYLIDCISDLDIVIIHFHT